MKYCQKCGNEIDDKAILCVKCGTPIKQKKPIFKKWWFWFIIVLVIIIGASAAGGSDNESGGDKTSVSSTQSTSSEEVIAYEVTDLQAMMDLLDENALKAEKTYQNKNVEVIGKIKNFDSDGNYISIEPVNADEWNFETVMCKVKDDKQLDFLLEKAVGDKVTIKGKVVSVGEVLGYTIDITEVQ